MLTAFIRTALQRARYETLEDGSFYAEIPETQGVYANASTLEACRDELQSALEDWLVFSLANGFPIPPLAGIDLNPTKVA
jgi:predicted RNase H-like HicB family nuclease